MLSTGGEYLSELPLNINDLPIEESTIMSSVILYVSQNILQKDKIKNLNSFIIKNVAKYILLYLFHTYILHDHTYKLMDFNIQLPLLIQNHK